MAHGARSLGELAPADGVSESDFWLVDDPFTNLNRSQWIDRAQLSLLVRDVA